jgi:hypothetical protein
VVEEDLQTGLQEMVVQAAAEMQKQLEVQVLEITA